MTTDMLHALGSPTAVTSDLAGPSVETPTAVSQLTEVIETAGWLRMSAHQVQQTSADLHHGALMQKWQQVAGVRGKAAPAQMLEDLADLGFGWRDVARMLNVSIPAVQKWRRSGGVTGSNRRKIASLLAVCDMLAEQYFVSDVASWFEMPLTAGAPVTPIDLFAADGVPLLFEYAGGHGDPERVLSEFDPTWRERYDSDFEVYREADGQHSIRPKGE